MLRNNSSISAVFFSAFAASALMVAHASAQSMTYSGMSPSEVPPPFPGPHAPIPPNAPDMQAVLDAQAKMSPKPIETLTPAEARVQPSPADGAKAVMKRKGLPTQPDPSVATTDSSYGSDPLEIVRVYKPVKPGPTRPLIVYYHGGGWVIADLQTYDPTPRMLAKKLDAVVVSVEYRKAPEAKFPAQHEDAARAYGYALKMAKSWGADPARTALAGESAGGNLAVATAIYARDHGLTKPVAVLAVYPIASSSKTLPSRMDNADSKPLNTAMLSWFTHYWARSDADSQDPRINLVAADLKGLPPVTIVNAQNDPLRSDGETLATALRAAGDDVEQRTFPGVTHEFFGMGMVVEGAKAANAFALDRLKPALAAH